MSEKISILKDVIKCPECDTIQDAEIELGFIWATYIHTCKNCKYIIMESEWDSQNQNYGTK